jgi:hypothetical protein
MAAEGIARPKRWSRSHVALRMRTDSRMTDHRSPLETRCWTWGFTNAGRIGLRAKDGAERENVIHKKHDWPSLWSPVGAEEGGLGRRRKSNVALPMRLRQESDRDWREPARAEH